MNLDSLITTIKHVLTHDMKSQHAEKFSPSARLNEDLYIDSVVLMQMLIQLELSYDIEVPESAISQDDVKTVESFAYFILSHQDANQDEDNTQVQEVPFEDIKVHCFVSCLCESIKASPKVDHRPFYFGVWDADVVVTEEFTLAYHDESVSHDFFIQWYKRIYGVEVAPWYDNTKTKAQNIAELESLLDNATDSQNIMVMLDMYLLPERENKFNQNPFPHYVMLKKTDNQQRWFMSDPDFRWEGEVERTDVINAITSPHVAGGYLFDSNDIAPSSLETITEYFKATFLPNHNVLTDAIRKIVVAHRDYPNGKGAHLGEALKQIPVLAIRKYAYEHGFAYFWRDIGFPEVTFELWCDEIEKLVSTYKAIQYRAIKLSELAKESKETATLFEEIIRLLDEQDSTEKKIKSKLNDVYCEWLAFHKLHTKAEPSLTSVCELEAAL
ncbi:phosphopantetheine-binding protein [Alteromonas sp. BL110]|uniref:DUF6005 family protein n=1 Tax=Alteromonas sp. BL110 TaxID=1714845 RepID=UPI000E4E7361|nr:DUF6005 family protein [Alteromonas sp. BL110]AXT40306.1 phosphopantetheine-binding protein [Alteromonas sp. BL110]RKM79538.1 phosphopantetheine-binding protein [Alteromonas sp. BL110]